MLLTSCVATATSTTRDKTSQLTQSNAQDPGNWATDLQAGSQFGYAHLFIILFAGLIALLFQILSTRLGCVSNFGELTR